MTPDFESHRSDWCVRVTVRELLEVHLTVNAINQKTNPGHIVWLTKGENGKRLWIYRDRTILAWVTADGEATDPSFALPIPELFVEELIDFVDAGNGVDIFYNEVDDTIVARSDNVKLHRNRPPEECEV